MRPARLLPLFLLAAACVGAPVVAAGCGGSAGDEALGRTEQALSTGVVISGVYGGGGNTGAIYQNDYVELFNRGKTDVTMTSWSIQYGSSANAFTQIAKIPSTTIKAGQYFLVQLAAGSAIAPTLPAADFIPTAGESINMSASSGKVALVSDQTLLTCGAAGSPCTDSVIVDLVGYGSSTASEGTTAAGAASGTALTRNGTGCMETDDNATDFSVTGTPNVRNTATAALDCSTYDAGPPAETGTATDSGAATDSGSSTDSGTVTDTGSTSPDTAVEDTAMVVDTGTKADTGTKPDTGIKTDGGTLLPVDEPASACSCDAPGRHADSGTRSTLALASLTVLAWALGSARRRR